jgi:anti-anti-sigma factor
MLRIDIHATTQTAILHCAGRIVLGLEAETLRCMAESRPEPCLVLDLSEVHSLDAAGLGLLVELHCRAQERGQALRVMNPSRGVRALIALTNLQSVLEVGYSEDQAQGCGKTRSRLTRRFMTA